MADKPLIDEPVFTELSAVRRELSLLWEAHAREHDQHDKAHAREHEFAAEAIRTAATLAKENKTDANEWRASMNDRESRFSTKDETKGILSRLDTVERSELVSAERERTKLAEETEDKRQSERRQSRAQWTIGLVVGLMATFGAVLINLIIRLATTPTP